MLCYNDNGYYAISVMQILPMSVYRQRDRQRRKPARLMHFLIYFAVLPINIDS